MNTRTLLLILSTILLSINSFAQVPIFQSNAGSDQIVFLDFDGQTITGTSWNSYNSGNPLVCAAPALSNTDIEQIFNIVAEDFRPFNINVTTDSNLYNAAAITHKIRVLFTPTSSWYGSAGGVAFLSTYGSISNKVCFVFTNQLGGNINYMAEAASHEAGHTLSLSHHSDWSAACTKNNEYYYGVGSGENSWAPIMGVGYYKNQTTWSNIAANGTCYNSQNDMEKMISSYNNGVAFRADDHSDSLTGATVLSPIGINFNDSGVITTNSDVDVFKLNIMANTKLNLVVNPWNYGASNHKANIDIVVKIMDSLGNVIFTSDSSNVLSAYVNNLLLYAGEYYISIDGGSGPNNGLGYGSVGKFFITGTLNPDTTSTLDANFVTSNNFKTCRYSGLNFFSQSTGVVSTYNWTFTNGTPNNSSAANPTNIVYNTTGTHNVRLIVSNGIISDTFNKTIVVNGLPTINVTPSNPVSCQYTGVEIVASGANYYEWTQASTLSNWVLPKTKATVATTTTYTVTGINTNGCTNTKSVTVNYATNPIITKTPTDNYIYTCQGDSVTLNVYGASSYKWSNYTSGLSDSVGATVKALPTIYGVTYYNVTATDTNGCKGYTYFQVIKQNCDSLVVGINSDTAAVCLGGCVNFSDFSTGHPVAWQWTFEGGNPSTSTLQNPGIVCYTDSVGQFDVTLTIWDSLGNNITKIFSNYVGVANTPNVVITASSAKLCYGDTVTLTASGASWYDWQPDSSLNNIWSSTVKAFPLASKIYTTTGNNYVYGGGNNGFVWVNYWKYCYATTSIYIPVYLNPSISFVQTPAIAFTGDTLKLSNNIVAGLNYNWTGAFTSTDDSLIIPNITTANSGIYTLSIIDSNGCKDTSNLTVTINPAIVFNAKVFLSGAYNSSTGKMNSTLSSLGLVPLTEPYSLPSYNSIYIHANGGGGETINPSSLLLDTSLNAIVDWVFLELRNKLDSTQVLATKAALVQRDGDIVESNGNPNLQFRNSSPDDYFITVKHRNHFGVMTKFPVLIDEFSSLIDFTNISTPLYRRPAPYNNNFAFTPTQDSCTRVYGAVRALYAGNGNISTVGTLQPYKFIRYNGANNDRSLILPLTGITGTVNGYRQEDYNLNGNVKYNGAANDRTILLQNIGSNLNNTVYEQLPY